MAMTHRPCDDCGQLVKRQRIHGAIPRRCEPCRLVHRKQIKQQIAAKSYAKNRDQILNSAARYRAENPDTIRESNRNARRKWRESNREQYNERHRIRRREKYANDPEYRERLRISRIALLYGISEARYMELLKAQGGRCLICRRSPPEGRNLHVDHDHKCCPTRKWSCGDCVRGLLCEMCNRGIGCFGDDIDRLRSAISYMESTV